MTHLICLLYLLLSDVWWKGSHAGLHARHGLYRRHLTRVIFAWVVPAEKKSRRCEVKLRGAIRQTLSGVDAGSKTRIKRYISGVGD
jgi:hypothetical protein